MAHHHVWGLLHWWRTELQFRVQTSQFPKLPMDKDLVLRQKLNKHSMNTKYLFNIWLLILKKGGISIFPISFQESWKNLEHIFNLKYNVELKFHVHASKVSSNMRSCLGFFPSLLFKTQKVVFQPPSWASIMKSFKRPISTYHGNRNWKKLGNYISCLQSQTKIMAGIIVQWSQLLLGLSTNCWSRSCSLSLLTLLSGPYFVTDDFETTTVLIFLQGGIIISISSLKAIQQISTVYIQENGVVNC